MQFVWDERKAASNLRKHRVSSAESVEVFFDPLVVTTLDERYGEGEAPILGLGRTQAGRLLAVAFTDGRELIRVLSARLAPRKEREIMKQTIEIEADGIPPEIDFSRGARGRFSGRIVNDACVVVIEPELAKVFPTAKAVNQALRAVAEANKALVVKPRRRESAGIANQSGKTRGRKAS